MEQQCGIKLRQMRDAESPGSAPEVGFKLVKLEAKVVQESVVGRQTQPLRSIYIDIE